MTGTEIRRRFLEYFAGKGHATYRVIGTVKHPFDEREIVARLVA